MLLYRRSRAEPGTGREAGNAHDRDERIGRPARGFGQVGSERLATLFCVLVRFSLPHSQERPIPWWSASGRWTSSRRSVSIRHSSAAKTPTGTCRALRGVCPSNSESTLCIAPLRKPGLQQCRRATVRLPPRRVPRPTRRRRTLSPQPHHESADSLSATPSHRSCTTQADHRDAAYCRLTPTPASRAALRLPRGSCHRAARHSDASYLRVRALLQSEESFRLALRQSSDGDSGDGSDGSRSLQAAEWAEQQTSVLMEFRDALARSRRLRRAIHRTFHRSDCLCGCDTRKHCRGRNLHRARDSA